MKAQLLSLAVAVALGCAGAAFAQGDKAHDFLKKAIEGDNSEVMLGKLAVEQGGDKAVKRFGQMLVDDHSMHREKVAKIDPGLANDQDVMPKAMRERDKLAGLHGRDFDKEFARYMVDDHREDLADFRKAGRMRGDAGKLARQSLPTLEKHLRTAERIKS